MALASGTRLGPYQIESPIGAGGMGEVYKATDTRLERTVAIKVLPAQVASDPERKSRFEREAKTVAPRASVSGPQATARQSGQNSRIKGSPTVTTMTSRGSPILQ